jgi:hypothetical protein
MNGNTSVSVCCLMVTFIVSTIVVQSISFAQQGTGPGYPGYTCVGGPGGYCFETPCVNGVCTSCGQPGYFCCPGGDCYFEDEGYTCITGYCINPTSQSCGQVGLPACVDPVNGPYCFTGVEDAGDCIACGQDYWQPCCPNTQYECDYGECIAGICVPEDQASSGGGDDTGPSGGDGGGDDTETNGGDGGGDDSLEFCFIGTLQSY